MTPGPAAHGGRLARARAAMARRFGLDAPRGLAASSAAVAALCALLSLLRGQDANWDLRNYHLHNAWSWLHGRLAVDLAPAQLQSYFVPLLDVPYYLLVQHAPAPLAGALLGALHGLAFLPVAWIAWRALDGDARRGTRAPLLALAGLAGAAFLSELGNTMGDTSTAPLLLGALALVLPDPHGRWRNGRIALAGVLLGLGVALKLTNAVYAVALGLAVLSAPLPLLRRLGAASLLTLVSLAVFAGVAGPWLHAVWRAFGNPLFPQFNAWFDAPLALAVPAGDTRWLPDGLGEALLRPFLFTANPYLVSEIALLQIAWPVLYVAAVVAGLAWLWRRVGAWRMASGRATAAATGSSTPGGAVRRMLGVYLLAGFVLWMAVFSIQRYLVVLELLSPLALWLLLRILLPARLHARLAGLAVTGCALVALAGWNDWGHAPWRGQAFQVQAPPAPVAATVLVVGPEPQAWRLPFLPADAAYIAVGSNFPESADYVARVAAMISRGGGNADAIVHVPVDRKAGSVGRRNLWAMRLGLAAGDCPILRWMADRSRSVDLVESAQSPDGQCRLVAAGNRALATHEADRESVEHAAAVVARYRLVLDPARCVVLDSRIGGDPHPYRWCRLAAASP